MSGNTCAPGDWTARVREFAVSSATVELAAQAAQVIPARIAKTLSFLSGEGKCILIVAAGDARVDNKRFKSSSASRPKCCRPIRSGS